MNKVETLQNGRIVFTGPNSNSIIEGDSAEYEILRTAANSVKHLKGLTIELGVRLGLGSAVIMDINPNDKLHVAVDPYGNIEYADDKHGTFRSNYTNELRNECLYGLSEWVYREKKNFLFLVLEDTEFFKRYADGVPVYNETKQIINEYSLVHFDGPHTTDAVKTEVEFFDPRLQVGGIFVFDDIDLYDHDAIEKMLLTDNKYVVFQKGNRKASYRKCK